MPNLTVVMGAGLVAIGLLLAGYGLVGGIGSSGCGTFVDVHQDDGRSDLPRTQFGDLTERAQTSFRKALDSDGLARVPADESLPSAFEEPTVVVYQGEQYRAGTVSNDGCASLTNGIKGIPTTGGSLLLVAGVYATVRRRHG